MAGYPLNSGAVLTSPRKYFPEKYLITSGEVVNEGDAVGMVAGDIVIATNGAGTVANIIKPLGLAKFLGSDAALSLTGDGSTVYAAIVKRALLGPMTSTLVPGLSPGLPVYLAAAPVGPLAITALTNSSGTATATVASTANLISGQTVTITGAVDPVSTLAVSSLTQTSGTASATVSDTTGIVVGQQVLIAGASPAAYNGLKTVLSVSGGTHTIVTFAIASGTASPATGTITLTPESPYNGVQTITVTSGTQFTFTVPATTASSPAGTIVETPPLLSNFTCVFPAAGEAVVPLGYVDADGATLVLDVSVVGELQLQSTGATIVGAA